MKIRIWVAVGIVSSGLLALPAVGPAQAADQDGLFAVEGGGARSCEYFLSIEDDGEKGSVEYSYFMGWMQGYVTGINRFQPGTFDLIPWQNTKILTLILQGICQTDPQMTFFRAVDVMATVMSASRLEASSPVVKIGEGENEVAVYEAILQRAQARLQALGYFEGEPDGKFGPATQKALEAFQKDSGEEITGVPDLISLYRLFSEE